MPAASHLRADDANDMWEDQDEEEEEEEDGLAGQLLSDILATSKYGECGQQPCTRGARRWGLSQEGSLKKRSFQ